MFSPQLMMPFFVMDGGPGGYLARHYDQWDSLATVQFITPYSFEFFSNFFQSSITERIFVESKWHIKRKMTDLSLFCFFIFNLQEI